MKEIPTWRCVVAGALRRSDGLWLLHRRPLDKELGGRWEFPGGKVEPGETPAVALVRELAEELGITIAPSHGRPVGFAERGGPNPIVILLYTVDDWAGEPEARERGAAIRWLPLASIREVDLAPLDQTLAEALFDREAR